MERVCIKCGEITQGEVELCVHCGAKLNAPIEVVVDETPKVEMPVGTKTQTIVVVSFIISLVNLILGPVSVGVAIFSPMLPSKLFQVVPFMVVLGYTLLLPIVASSSLILYMIARRKYNPEIHSPKNFSIGKLSYRFSVCAVLLWFIIIITGLGLTFYNIKMR